MSKSGHVLKNIFNDASKIVALVEYSKADRLIEPSPEERVAMERGQGMAHALGKIIGDSLQHDEDLRGRLRSANEDGSIGFWTDSNGIPYISAASLRIIFEESFKHTGDVMNDVDKHALFNRSETLVAACADHREMLAAGLLRPIPQRK